MEADKLKLKTLLFFFNAIKELNTAVDSALDSLDNNELTEQEKFILLLSMLGHYGLNADLFTEQASDTMSNEEKETKIGSQIEMYDYESFHEERFELLLLNGVIGFDMPLN